MTGFARQRRNYRAERSPHETRNQKSRKTSSAWSVVRHNNGLKHVRKDGYDNGETGNAKDDVRYVGRQEGYLNVEKRILAIPSLTYINRF